MQLREHKDRKGLSISALAARTGFGKTSWDRYLNGRAVPPEGAVEALALACNTDAVPLLELRQLAVSASAEDEPSSAGPDTEEDTSGERRQPVPWFAMLLSSVTTGLLILLGLMLVAPWEGAEETGGTADSAPLPGPVHPDFGTFVYNAGTTYECQVERDEEDGLLYAGYSRTRSDQLQRDASGWAVVEAQCLLEHRSSSPSTVDGAFGNNTDRAVRRLQDRARIAVDGIVGPDTWKVLRK
ncbi:helix-turn-helix domain-containing protein [Streptomyces sp. NPDC051784]|uniref:helix-turn-helix domain-containing protein n=1 Tax=Streptomyces sp. NPDC051784 TaxID=3155805 RepID=UPI00344A86E6